jgi:hypothetical protein
MNRRPWWLLPPGRVNPAWWLALGAVMLGIEYWLGPSLHYPVVYVLPVSLAAWYSGRWTAVAFATAVPALRLALLAAEPGPFTAADYSLALATVLRGAVIVVMGLWFARLGELERDLAHRVDTLEGLLPICAICKNIRNDQGEWERLEAYISKRSEAQFSHGVCPSCMETHYAPELGR